MSWLDDIKWEKEEWRRANEEWRAQKEREKQIEENWQDEKARVLDEAFKTVSPIVDRLLNDLQKELGLTCKRVSEAKIEIQSTEDNQGGNILIYHEPHKTPSKPRSYLPVYYVPAYVWLVQRDKLRHFFIGVMVGDDAKPRIFTTTYTGHLQKNVENPLDEVYMQEILKSGIRALGMG